MSVGIVIVLRRIRHPVHPNNALNYLFDTQFQHKKYVQIANPAYFSFAKGGFSWGCVERVFMISGFQATKGMTKMLRYFVPIPRT